jgi:hypothetical protein
MASTNEQVGDLLNPFVDLLSWVFSERRTFEERGNGVTCEKGKSEWELAVETWVEREPEKSRTLEGEEEKFQERGHSKGYRKCGFHLSNGSKPEDDGTDLEANGNLGTRAQELLDHIVEINSAYCATDDLHEDQPLHQPRNRKPSSATPNDHQIACQGSNSPDPTPPYPAFSNQDQHSVSWLMSYYDCSTSRSWQFAFNCVGSSSISPQYPGFSWISTLLPVDPDVHRSEYGDFILTRKTLRALDRSLEDERRQNIKRFRENFIHQHRLLVDTVRQHPIWLNPLVNQLRSHRDAWDSAVSTMRRLSRLEAPLSLENALCFLCASRAVVESSSEDDKLAYMSSFAQDLETWREMFPQVEHFARIMWDLTMDHIPPTFRPTDAASWHTIFALRELVATLVARTRFLFGLEEYGSVTEPGKLPVSSLLRWKKSSRSVMRRYSLKADIPDEPELQVCPNITRLRHIASKTPGCDPAVVVLATGFIFALVIQFVLGEGTSTFSVDDAAQH